MTRRSSIKHRLLELRAYVFIVIANRLFRRGMKKHNEANAAQVREGIDLGQGGTGDSVTHEA